MVFLLRLSVVMYMSRGINEIPRKHLEFACELIVV